jgi:hypothetical protein
MRSVRSVRFARAALSSSVSGSGAGGGGVARPPWAPACREARGSNEGRVGPPGDFFFEVFLLVFFFDMVISLMFDQE